MGTESGLCLWHTSSAPQPSQASPLLGAHSEHFNSERDWGSESRAALPRFGERSSAVLCFVLPLPPRPPPFLFGVSLALCMRLIKRSASFFVLNHPVKDAGVTTPTWGQRQCWWDLGECSCGRQRHALAQHLTELPPKASSSGGRPSACAGWEAWSRPLWGLGIKSWPRGGSSSSTLRQGSLHLQRQSVDGMTGGKGHFTCPRSPMGSRRGSVPKDGHLSAV